MKIFSFMFDTSVWHIAPDAVCYSRKQSISTPGFKSRQPYLSLSLANKDGTTAASRGHPDGSYRRYIPSKP